MYNALDGLSRSLVLISRGASKPVCRNLFNKGTAQQQVCHRALRGQPHLHTARFTTVRAMSTADIPPPTSPRKVKLALCQLPVGRDKDVNIQQANDAIKEAAQQGAQLIVLPEMWSCPYRNDAFDEYAEAIGDDGRAKQHNITLIGGSIPERCHHDNRLYNTCCVYGPQGQLLATHRKVHLFDIDIPGKITFKESDTLAAGNALTVVDTPAGRVGVGICYDVRFAEMAMIYAQKGAQLIVYPGAFNCVTGPAHWELLLRARALDNQLYVAGCGPARNPDSGFTAWGHSLIVGPFAEVVASTQEGPAIVYGDLEYGQVVERRANIPVRVQKRGDLYAVVETKG